MCTFVLLLHPTFYKLDCSAKDFFWFSMYSLFAFLTSFLV